MGVIVEVSDDHRPRRVARRPARPPGAGRPRAVAIVVECRPAFDYVHAGTRTCAVSVGYVPRFDGPGLSLGAGGVGPAPAGRRRGGRSRSPWARGGVRHLHAADHRLWMPRRGLCPGKRRRPRSGSARRSRTGRGGLSKCTYHGRSALRPVPPLGAGAQAAHLRADRGHRRGPHDEPPGGGRRALGTGTTGTAGCGTRRSPSTPSCGSGSPGRRPGSWTGWRPGGRRASRTGTARCN